MSGKRSFLERFISFAAFFMSLVTLLIFFYQTHLMREQSRLSVRPRIGFNSIETNRDSITIFEFVITNKGLGPAIIDSMIIIHDQQRSTQGISNFAVTQLPKLEDYAEIQSVTNFSLGMTLSPDEHVTLFRLAVPRSKLNAFYEYIQYKDTKASFFEIELYYSSIYQERWRINSCTEHNYPELLED